VAEVLEEIGGEEGQDGVGDDLVVPVGVDAIEQAAEVQGPSAVGAGAVATRRSGGVGDQEDLDVAVEEVEVGPDEGVDPVGGVGRVAGPSGPERWRPAEDGGLEVALGIVHERPGQAGLVAEGPEDGSLAHAGGRRQLVHRDRGQAALGNEGPGRAQQLGAVALGVGPPSWRALGQLKSSFGWL
jgi:hypothetical protein